MYRYKLNLFLYVNLLALTKRPLISMSELEPSFGIRFGYFFDILNISRYANLLEGY